MSIAKRFSSPRKGIPDNLSSSSTSDLPVEKSDDDDDSISSPGLGGGEEMKEKNKSHCSSEERDNMSPSLLPNVGKK